MPVGQREDPLSLLRHGPVSRVVPLGLGGDQSADGLRRTLGQAIGARRATVRNGRLDLANGAHALQLRGEVEALLDDDLELLGLLLVLLQLLLHVVKLLLQLILLLLVGLDVVFEGCHELLLHGDEALFVLPGAGRCRGRAGDVAPGHAVQRSNLNGVANVLALDLDQRVAARDDHGGHRRGLLHGSGLANCALSGFLAAAFSVCIDNADGDHLVGGQRPCFVEEAVLHSASIRHAEGLGAKDPRLQQAHEGRVHGESHLHGQGGRHH
mmetsp:Transcript_1762/g.4467  ORF Transcript_1762/g.4467 Transcript_1762/m.4467 type:complete len:268 (+) Transcript_1762:322-1125(+)